MCSCPMACFPRPRTIVFAAQARMLLLLHARHKSVTSIDEVSAKFSTRQREGASETGQQCAMCTARTACATRKYFLLTTSIYDQVQQAYAYQSDYQRCSSAVNTQRN